jgi:probable HAF family extracellular repeat protein
MMNIGSLGGSAHARALSEYGQVVGDSGTVDNAQFHAFSWTKAQGMVDLGALGQSESGAIAVNDRGQIVGYAALFEPLFEMHAVLWEPIKNLGCSATLAGCNLKALNLSGAYLSSANLHAANLKNADLSRANLTWANLTSVNLMDADLSHANLFGAQLDGAMVKDVHWANTTCPDGTNSDSNGGTCAGHLQD